ncbi:TraL conjugative transposon family protein [Bacteroidales bacterium OttesenSCG-928-K03]|nr:TraL conjugative transposon family protein [Bacteroidales bacterium OttesenSCG-928-L14]MDL2240173.1 TraL conjugative transposon family protein [Bacteroidales bacterium OttesenSCG-928-K22]MDL2242472.1 TraL conjugative transposon family protein [Bacteroidales bacterium OttesenSCG-928-K03]
MVKGKLSSLRNQLKEKLIKTCNTFSQRTRIVIIAVMFLALCGGCIFVIINAFRSIGKTNGQKNLPQVEHIKHLNMDTNDSIINIYKIPDNGTEFE